MNEQSGKFLSRLPDLHAIRELCWEELRVAAGNPDHPWCFCVFGTSEGQHPHLRMLVVREVDLSTWELTFHTDRRSPKVAQIFKNPATSIHFWNPAARVQLVLTGVSSVIVDEAIVKEQWERSSLTSRRAYLGSLPPGETADQPCVNFPSELIERPPSLKESEAGQENFAVIKTHVNAMDFLLLKQSGNVRAKFAHSTDSEMSHWLGAWVAP